MPYLLILLSLMIVSCGKKENALSPSGYIAPLEQRTFTLIKHEDGPSLIRSKILNKFVEEKMPTKNSLGEIGKGDEILGHDMDERDLKSFAESEKKFAKVVVSYTDREEIFFLPEYVPLKQIISKLNLKPEAGKIFKWVKTEALTTYSGGTFYLASVNTKDIVENDHIFYQETTNLYNRFSNAPAKILSGKLVEFTLEYETFLQREVGAEFKGRSRKCTKDLREADMCGECLYNRNVPSSEFDKTSNVEASELALTVKVGDQNFSLQSLNAEFVGPNKLKIKFDANNFDIRDELSVIFNSITASAIGKETVGYNYSDTCVGRSERGPISLQRRIDANIIMTVFGRGTAALKDVL